jgi:hypothetical protein
MIRNLVSRTVADVVRYTGSEDYRDYAGLLTSPRNNKNPEDALAIGASWAADNDCFTGLNAERIRTGLKRWQHLAHTCLFFNAPDVWQDAAQTLALFDEWQPEIAAYGYPVAFCLQDGITPDTVPWTRCEAVFIGGSNTFKYSSLLRTLVQEAKARGKWVHHGRVNSMARIMYSHAIGCDSFDGTNYTKAPWRVQEHLKAQLDSPALRRLKATLEAMAERKRERQVI